MTGGKDVITDYTTGKDKISVDGAANVSISKNGDAVVTVGKNTLTLKKLDDENPLTDGKQITFTDGNGATTKTYFNDRIVLGESVTLTSSFKGSLDAAGFTNVDAATVKAAVKIFGNAKNETIHGGKVNDIFIYGGGQENHLRRRQKVYRQHLRHGRHFERGRDGNNAQRRNQSLLRRFKARDDRRLAYRRRRRFGQH